MMITLSVEGDGQCSSNNDGYMVVVTNVQGSSDYIFVTYQTFPLIIGV